MSQSPAHQQQQPNPNQPNPLIVTPYHIALSLLVTETLTASTPPSPELTALVLGHLCRSTQPTPLSDLSDQIAQYSPSIAASIHTSLGSLCTTLGELQSYLRSADAHLSPHPTVTLDDHHAVCPSSTHQPLVARTTPAGLLFRRLRLAGDTLSFEALTQLHSGLRAYVVEHQEGWWRENNTIVDDHDDDDDVPTPSSTTLWHVPLADIVHNNSTTTTAAALHDLTAAIDHSHARFDHSIVADASSARLPAALLSLASLLEGRDMLAVDEAVRVAQQHADDDTLAHAMVFGEHDDTSNDDTSSILNHLDACRRRAAARLLPHLVAHCDLQRASIHNWQSVQAACTTTQRLAHAVALAPEIYCSPRILALGVHHSLCDALTRAAHVHAALYTGAAAATAGCYTLAQAAAASVLGGTHAPDIAVAYAQLASNALCVDIHMAQRVLELAGCHIPYETSADLAEARRMVAFHGALHSGDFVHCVLPESGSRRAQDHARLALAQRQYDAAYRHLLASPRPNAAMLVLLGRIVLAAGDAAGALPYVLSAMVQADALVAAQASVVLAQALLSVTPLPPASRAYATQLLRAALPLLATARHAMWLAKAHTLLATVQDGTDKSIRHLKQAACYYEQQGAWEDAASTWHLAALLRRDGDAVAACARALERCPPFQGDPRGGVMVAY